MLYLDSMVNNNTKTKQRREQKISLNLTKDEHETLKEKARKRGMTMSAHIRNKAIYET